MSSKIVKVISTALLAYFFINVISIIFANVIDHRDLFNAWCAMLSFIPFGGQLAQISISFMTEIIGAEVDLSKYLVAMEQPTVLNCLQDLLTLVLAGMCFEAVNNILQVITGIKDRKQIYALFMKMFISMVSSLLCTCIAIAILNFLYQNLALLPNLAQGLLSTLVTLITVGGAVVVLYFVLGKLILDAVIFVLLKLVLINVVKIIVTYCMTQCFLLGLMERDYFKMSYSLGFWIVVILIVVILDGVISSVLER